MDAKEYFDCASRSAIISQDCNNTGFIYAKPKTNKHSKHGVQAIETNRNFTFISIKFS